MQNFFNHRITESKLSGPILRCCRNVHKSVCKIARLVPQYRVTVLSFQLLLKTAEILHDHFSKVLYHWYLPQSHFKGGICKQIILFCRVERKWNKSKISSCPCFMKFKWISVNGEMGCYTILWWRSLKLLTLKKYRCSNQYNRST